MCDSIHADGTFLPKPFKIQTMHFWQTSRGGSTLFSPLEELVHALPPELRQRWDRLYFVGNREHAVHPLIYKHPVTKKDTLCFHCGSHFVDTILERDVPQPNVAQHSECRELTHSEISELLIELTRRYR